MSLADFNRLIYRVDAAEGDTQEDKDYEVCLAALAGRYFDHDRGIERRIFLNPREGGGMPPPSATYNDCDEHHYRVHRDYDSMFGMTKRLPYLRSLHVFPVASFRDTLTKRVHLTYPIIRDGVSEISLCAAVTGMTTGAMEQRTTFVELSKIPNVAFAKMDVHTKVNIMFPSMYNPHRDPRIPPSLLTDLYEKVMLPSLRAIRYEHIDHWPVDYEHAEIKARGRAGYHFTTVEIPSWKLRMLAVEMRPHLNAIPQFKDAFFYHEVRGVKGGSHHNPEDPAEAENALQSVFDHLDFNQLTDNDLQYHWFVDVALQVEHPTHVVHWTTASHANILAYLLPGATPVARENLIRSDNFQLDICAHMTDVAGFRVGTSTIGRNDNVHYINVYSTEKSVHYQLHGGVFQKPELRDLLPANLARLVKQVDTWTEVFLKAAGEVEDPADPPQEGQARLEIRVPVSICGTTFIDIPHNVIQESCISIPADEWW